MTRKLAGNPPNPNGICLCGCGETTPIAKSGNSKLGWIKGEHIRFCAGHRPVIQDIAPPNPSGFCMCGCGNPAPISNVTSRSKGTVAGHPMKYIHGHNAICKDWKEKFWSMVNVGSEDDCWEWTGKTSHGYGRITVLGKKYGCHILSYEIAYGKFEKGLCVCHKCDNRLCVNPKHLFLGTIADNNHDMVSKGRNKIPHPKGELHPIAKLVNEQILDIREMRDSGSTLKEISEKFGITITHVGRICKRKAWNHI